MNKVEVLQEAHFGSGTAELDEVLERTFVETVVWKEVWDGRVHSIYGAKGSGKSAIYASLKTHEAGLRHRHILLIPAENLTGNPVFQDLRDSPELANEETFLRLWSLYFLTLIADKLREERFASDTEARDAIQVLENLQLLPPRTTGYGLGEMLNRVFNYVRASISEVGVKATLPLPVGVYLVFRPPAPAEVQEGAVVIDRFYEIFGRVLHRRRLTAWVAIDRLDVAFVSDPEREGRALRALFQTAMMLRNASFATQLKIFLRTDIWDRITRERLPEASAIERAELQWGPDGIMDIITRRMLANRQLCREYGVDEKRVLRNIELRRKLFHTVFPPTMETDSGSIPTFEWLLTQIRDGAGSLSPRDAILFLKSARHTQLVRLHHGTADVNGQQLFDPETLVVAVGEVSRARLEQTLYAEYPEQREYIDRLRGQEATFPLAKLEELWEESSNQARQRAEYLCYLGFFQREGGVAGTYHVPPLYQHILHLQEISDDFR